uniref:Copper transporter n=1 Tax=Bursaphelenchus xylophilus TaxID=6326 RepID=A0A1I7SIJ1_BURXY
MKDEFHLHTSYKSCIAVELHWELALMGFSACSVTCTVAAVWMEWLKKKNRRLTRNRLMLQSLSARFQQTENSAMNDAIAPSMVGYMVMTFCGFILSFTRKYFVDNYGEDFILNKFATD